MQILAPGRDRQRGREFLGTPPLAKQLRGIAHAPLDRFQHALAGEVGVAEAVCEIRDRAFSPHRAVAEALDGGEGDDGFGQRLLRRAAVGTVSEVLWVTDRERERVG